MYMYMYVHLLYSPLIGEGELGGMVHVHVGICLSFKMFTLPFSIYLASLSSFFPQEWKGMVRGHIISSKHSLCLFLSLLYQSMLFQCQLSRAAYGLPKKKSTNKHILGVFYYRQANSMLAPYPSTQALLS